MKFEGRRKWFAIAAVVIVVVIVGVVALTRSDSSHDGDATNGSVTSTTSTTRPNGSSVSTTSSIPPGPYTTPSMPVEVSTTPSSNLRSGNAVTVHASPKTGSQMFGVEARLCRGDVAITSDADFTPTRGGNCIVNPLQPGTDAKVTVAGSPPYGGVDLTFRVGTGTDSFQTQYDGTRSVTCDATHPCQIVLKLQYPNGFGFQGVPVTFS